MIRRLNVPAVGIALGAVWGVTVLLATWLNGMTGGMETGWFSPLTRTLDWTYPGYGVGFFGGIWGGICALVHGVIVGALVAAVYNRVATPVDAQPSPGADEDD